MNPPLLSVRDLAVRYPVDTAAGRVWLQALGGVSFELAAGECLGLVGESGSGKSTLARALLRLVPASGGSAWFRGADLLKLRGAKLRAIREHLQMVFQDPQSALDPRMTVGQIIGEPLREFRPGLDAHGREQCVLAMMQRVGLLPVHLHRYPHEFSGGQAQRIGIARALILEPVLLLCDEPISALDVSIKSQLSNLLKDLQQQLKLAMLFIAHDLSAVRFSCDRVLVLYLGRVMELASRASLYSAARHPYTQALLQAIPQADPQRPGRLRPALVGEAPSPLAPPSGCVFRNRCPLAIPRCAAEVPELRKVSDNLVACHRAEETGPA
ncbi:MAG TPA: oligopeptide/dipeptide ABC transporter ATP-binding protein [Steroidobacteraceae bacterium]